MTDLPPEPSNTTLASGQAFQARPRSLIPAPVVAILVAGGLALLLVGSLPFLSQSASGAVRGIAFVCFGVVAMLFFAYTWWHRQPINVKGGLSPDRPFSYHVGIATLFGTGFILAMAGASLIKRWL